MNRPPVFELSESLTLPSSKNKMLEGPSFSVNKTVFRWQQCGAACDSNSLIAASDKDLKNSPSRQFASASSQAALDFRLIFGHLRLTV
jgi:hypothetical protein